MTPYFRVNGVEMLPYVVEGGLKWTRNDINSDDAGRDTLSGTMYVGRITTKLKVEITCLPLWTDEAKKVLQAIYPEYVTLETNLHPRLGEVVETVYSNNIPATTSTILDDGTQLIEDIVYPLVEI